MTCKAPKDCQNWPYSFGLRGCEGLGSTRDSIMAAYAELLGYNQELLNTSWTPWELEFQVQISLGSSPQIDKIWYLSNGDLHKLMQNGQITVNEGVNGKWSFLELHDSASDRPQCECGLGWTDGSVHGADFKWEAVCRWEVWHGSPVWKQQSIIIIFRN